MTIDNSSGVPAPVVMSQQDRAIAEWDSANATADEVKGASLIGGKENTEKLDQLLGVPFVITEVTFRQGDIRVPAKTGNFRDYVSVEALVHPDYQLKFKRAYIVFNDGSTGIYRQIMAYLMSRGMVQPVENLPEEGEANSTRYDVSLTSNEVDSSGVSFDIRLRCPEGLRKSDYQNDYGDAQTWYLA